MSGNTPHVPVARMDIPPKGGAGCLIFTTLFVGFCVALSAFHLVTYSEPPTDGVVAAVLWLSLTTLTLGSAVYAAGGLGPCAVVCLGTFSSRTFVEVSLEGDRIVIAFGYEMFRRRFYYLTVARGQIVSLEMRSGQATALAGRDMDDWHVALWYRDPTRAKRKHIEGVRDDEVYVVCPPRAKVTTEVFLRSVVTFLCSVGVELHPVAKENAFRVVAIDGDPLTPPSPPGLSV
ncbi:hypothetical protein [Frigoriglobus tundricola]|uniref:Transmembrane protein n=1 Tax=Frigoriglobus tundricola TaxID=2774151 RepID=A0A6M5YRH9_9BACT|nr:hypothetical protein [Frigoriglobus tundricola]QJW95966.1 hypothetical protein FTUN_3520 [Frigoriglobus tundricola]